MRKEIVKSVLLMIVFFMAISVSDVNAAGQGQADKAAPAPGGAAPAETIKSYSGFPLPIVSKPVELTAMIQYTTLRPNQDTTEVWDWFAAKTGIKMKPTVIKDKDKLAIIFASRDFPDVYMSSGASETILLRAAQDGDIVSLDDLVKNHAPTWDKFLNENPIVKNSCKLDGKLYSLPNFNGGDFVRDLRDQWFITKTWLDELGLKIPTTTDEFKSALIAIKNNAGKGSIPKNVIPYYYFFDAYNGGQFDVYGCFGVTITDVDYLVVENGKVIYQAINPKLKAPLKWLQELYKEGLTPPECFTDDTSSYLNKISANPPIVGSYTSYAIRNMENNVPVAPLKSPQESNPKMRRQAYVSNPARAFMLFANNPIPVETVKFCEYIAYDLEAHMTSTRGIKDILWKFVDGGKVSEIFWEEDPGRMVANGQKLGLHNSFIGLWDKNFYSNYFYDRDASIVNSRSWAFNNIYKNYLGREGSVYVKTSLSQDEENLISVYNTDLTNLRKQTFSRWITTNANIDAEWDTYVAEIKKLHVDEFLALKQKAYDVSTAK
jgi:putative aldouronate transport system substrate-binding protein